MRTLIAILLALGMLDQLSANPFIYENIEHKVAQAEYNRSCTFFAIPHAVSLSKEVGGSGHIIGASILGSAELSMMLETPIKTKVQTFSRKTDGQGTDTVTTKVGKTVVPVRYNVKQSPLHSNIPMLMPFCRGEEIPNSARSQLYVKLERFERVTTSEHAEPKHERVFKVSLSDDNQTTWSPFIDTTSVKKDVPKAKKQPSSRPAWILNPPKHSIVSVTPIYQGDIGTAVIEAMFLARCERALEIESDIKTKITNFARSADQNVSEKIEKTESSVVKQVAKQTVRDSYLKTFWIDTATQELYLLVNVSNEPVHTHLTESENTLWKQFQAKESNVTATKSLEEEFNQKDGADTSAQDISEEEARTLWKQMKSKEETGE